MINNAFGLIWTGEEAPHLKELTAERSIAAVPFGGRYRAIDFPLSNLVNTGVTNVGVITQRNYNSLMDHIMGGGAWDLNRKRDGLFFLAPFFTRENSGSYRGTVDALQGAVNYIRKVPYQYCIFMGSNAIYNTSFEKMMEQHLASGADVTCLYNIEPVDSFVYEDSGNDVRFVLNERGRITDMEIDSLHPRSSNCSMGCMIIEKSLLDYLLNECHGRGYVNFLREVIFARLDSLKVYGFRYDDYVARLDSISTYFRTNMDVLKADVRADLFSADNPIYTKVKNEAPTRYADSARIKNSLLADGCIIEGEVENCVLSRGVRVAKGAVVKNCILMQSSTIQNNAHLENVILDKNVLVRSDRRLLGTENFPVIIRKNAVV